jgi:amino acid adenylation domain-containing protein
LETQLSYWKNKLANIPVLHLSPDRPRPPMQSYRGESQFIVLSQELSMRLKDFSRDKRVTPFMTLLAAFKTLLYRWTGQDDIVVGSPIANRNQTEMESLIGFFVNTLVIRTHASGESTFSEFLARVRETALEAYAHQDLPFEKLVQELKPKRDLSRHPLFQVMFQLRNQPSETLQLEGIRIEPLEFESGIAKFDLNLAMMEDETGRLGGSLEYSTDLFDYATIKRLLSHFHELLTRIVDNPEQRIAEIPLLTNSERHQLLVEWNSTQKGYPREKCIHELFEEQVEKTPDAVAVIFENERLTYGELNVRANQLAHYLKKQGVEAERLVGICMERSLDMIVGLLGILKAGGAYVPLDPSYPKERLAFMLQDAQAKVVLTQERLIAALPESGARLVCLDRDRNHIVEESGDNPISEATAESLAYVTYTSGSSGQPKGVEVPHRGVLRLLCGVEYVQLDGNRTFLHLASTSFDASTFEIWGALLHGAKCVLFPGKIASPNEIGEILRHHKITTLWLTASLFNTVIDEAPEVLSEVHQLLIGGEALSIPHVRRAAAVLPGTQIINGYGPTESTTFTCSYPIPVRLDESISSIPIGRPIANTEVYLLDAHGSPVPVGIPGELYIGGDGLARGYLSKPELTAEKFIPHPFTKQPGGRLYKTGDLARYLRDGNIEFLGRSDHQVKIHGFRIEPGEIESVLGQHSAVREAVLVAREDTPGDKRLVAYIILRKEQVCTSSELQGFLKHKLPEYMIPSAFVLLDTLPLTPNGKIDRKALPAPDQSRREKKSYVAPRTAVERRLADIWSEVLKLDQVGTDDNFFELGGHSLLATQVMSRVRDAFQLEITLRMLFEHPKVAELAVQIVQLQAESGVAEGMAEVLADVESLSDKEAKRLLVRQGSQRSENRIQIDEE